MKFAAPAFAALIFMSPQALAGIVYDESIDGDLSGAFSSPTLVDFSSGDNTIIGQAGSNGNGGATNGSDGDYFTFVIEANESLDSLFVGSRVGPGTRSFIGYVAATSFGGQGSGDIDGSHLFSDGDGNILDNLTGSNDPLGPGNYSFWVQETANGNMDYQFTFNVSAVPEPSSALGSLMLVACGLLRRQRRVS
ncbi:MAG: PEP-CTERM sorting domain-containing protein [Planctomycetota bacterium]